MPKITKKTASAKTAPKKTAAAPPAAETPVAQSKARKPREPKAAGKLSALDAAAQVLAASDEPLGCKEMIEAMAAQGLWTSPGGKTPHATLYSAIMREVNAKGDQSRFRKTDRGRFTANV